MMTKRFSKIRMVSTVFGCLFGMMGIIGAAPVYAEPVESPATENVSASENTENTDDKQVENETTQNVESKSCQESLGALGWLVCPATGKVSEAVDFLYDKIEEVLVINPATMEDGQPIYEIWKYMRGVTNILFIIFLLVMVYSQLTGMGINNYGLKKTLPKLIVGAILVNLSFVICSLAVDVSNIVGGALRGLFETIETNTLATTTVSGAAHVSMAEMYAALSGGTGLAIGAGVVAFEAGAIWMLIPTVLGAITAVVIGLITIALRQAVVAILIMIAPLAVMAYILPNTEKWFRQWKDLLFRMLVFYPMFSLLFGASSLAGWAIIVSASSGFWVLVGVLVQMMPLVLSWSLMKMSGTFLSNVNAKLSSMVAKPLAVNRGWAESRRELTRQKYLASRDVFTPSLRLTQFLSDRRVAREEETKEHAETVKLRGQAYAALRNYRSRNMKTISHEGEEAYEAQYRRAQYQQTILRHQNNFNKGIGGMGINAAQNARLEQLDNETIRAFDKLKMEQARTEKIDYDNAVGFHKRMEDAMNAHFDSLHVGEATYKRHDIANRLEAESRYATALGVMDGNLQDTQYTAAFAAHAYDTQAKIISSKFQKYFELTPPTRDVRYRLEEFSKYQEAIDQWLKEQNGEIIAPGDRKRAVDNIDAIVSGLRVLNMRGDTDFVKGILDDVMDEKYGGLTLGTHASQALAGFLMFDVKDNDPWLRRFGKYINLQTAAMYDHNDRKKQSVDYEEYLKGYYYEPGDEPKGPVETEDDIRRRKYPKKNMVKLMEGTSLDGVERTAFDNINNSLKKAYGYDAEHEDKEWDVEGWMKKREEMQTAIEPQFLSAVLKYLSGSEQMTSAVKFWTGYEPKVRKDKDGNVMLDENNEPIYDLTPVWEKGFGKSAEKVRKFFQRKTKDYIKDQTPMQIIQMRTDVRDAIAKHMLDAYKNDTFNDGANAEAHLAEYEAAKMAIETQYVGDLSKEQADERAAKLKKLDMKYAGAEIRSILGPDGTLEQIWNTRRTSSANAAKTWNRSWLLLDDVDRLEREVEYYKAERARKTQDDTRKGSDTEEQAKRTYTDADRQDFVNHLDNFCSNHKDEEAGAFYNMLLGFIDSKVGSNSLMRATFEDRVEKERRGDDKFKMQELLKELLIDPNMYPDA